MLNDLTIAYLTGSATVTENHLSSDTVVWNNKHRTIGQMFFQPYESSKEFIFCARHTFISAAFLGLAIIDPFVLSIPVILGGIAAGIAVVGGISKLLGNDGVAAFTLGIAEYIIQDICQTIIDVIVLPLSALTMCTRGISTGLKATGLYDYDTATENKVLSPSMA